MQFLPQHLDLVQCLWQCPVLVSTPLTTKKEGNYSRHIPAHDIPLPRQRIRELDLMIIEELLIRHNDKGYDKSHSS